MITHAYLDAVRQLLHHYENTQLEAIERGADMIAAALTQGGVLYSSEIGHGIQGDFIHRAGGMAAIRPFSYKLEINAPVPKVHQDRPRSEALDSDLETVRFAVRSSNLRAGDVMLIGSVSGRNRAPVELALACRTLGVKTIGFTSLAYTRRVESYHPSGKRLCEAVDLTIDNGAPFGDAALQIPGYDIPLVPLSGVSCDLAGWLLQARTLEKMAAAGTPASVLLSVNRDDGKAYNAKAEERYNRQGY